MPVGTLARNDIEMPNMDKTAGGKAME